MQKYIRLTHNQLFPIFFRIRVCVKVRRALSSLTVGKINGHDRMVRRDFPKTYRQLRHFRCISCTAASLSLCGKICRSRLYCTTLCFTHRVAQKRGCFHYTFTLVLSPQHGHPKSLLTTSKGKNGGVRDWKLCRQLVATVRHNEGSMPWLSWFVEVEFVYFFCYHRRSSHFVCNQSP